MSRRSPSVRKNDCDRTAANVIKAYQKGNKIHQAWTNCSYVKGAKHLGYITLFRPPYQEQLADMPLVDLYDEGNLWISKEEFLQIIKASPNDVVWVVRFKVEAINANTPT
ncbi:hypothetical protein I8751_17885 [Nostocaceae cyanobacterium CENA357]|uniref:Uncharacterized protein n=1 Tax=Atlanticothrix silvestris CENA357 TaxID=1725252 RepID=A0A8J7HL44_9CYAN|nr:hypothetical protein [Atlanticothrix silvestris]MBH8554200.1 hypothetical protein [Atlanticothrix silvestris CENA357]